MKKTALVILISALFSMYIWAVWEGNAGVGSSYDFSQGGMFVKSDMFPKHTLLEIVNLENNESSRAVVLGASGTSGLLVNLSPELAKTLNVRAGKVVRVRITTPTHVSEGSGLEEMPVETKDIDYNPKLAIENSKIVESEPVKNAEPGSAVFFDTPSSKDYTRPEPVKVIEEPVVEPDPVENIYEPSEKSEPSKTDASEKVYLEHAEMRPPTYTQPHKYQQNPETLEPMQKKEIPQAPVQVVGSPSKPKDNVKSEDYNPVKTVDNVYGKKTMVAKAENVKPVYEVQNPKKPVIVDEEVVNDVSEVDSPVEPVYEVRESDKAVNVIDSPEKPEEFVDKTENPVDVVDSPAMAPKKLEKPDEAVSYVETLKTSEKIAEKTEIPAKEVESIDDTKDDESREVYESPECDEKEEMKEEKSKKEKKVNAPVVIKYEPEIEEYELEDDTTMYVGKLQRGKYYLQIANYKKELNVKGVLHKHSKTYPIAVQTISKGHTQRYKVFVGPLAKDEMGAVMERFYKFGFKDSFFKVIK